MIPNKKVRFIWTGDECDMYADVYRLIHLVEFDPLSIPCKYSGQWHLYATTSNIFNHTIGVINNPCWQKLVGVENE